MKTPFFPFTLCANERFGGSVGGGVKTIWLKHKPVDKSWYLVDVVVKSHKKVTFKVYGMASLAYGGRGAHECDVHAELSREEMEPLLNVRAYELATEEREREKEEEEKRIIQKKACMLIVQAMTGTLK